MGKSGTFATGQTVGHTGRQRQCVRGLGCVMGVAWCAVAKYRGPCKRRETQERLHGHRKGTMQMFVQQDRKDRHRWVVKWSKRCF